MSAAPFDGLWQARLPDGVDHGPVLRDDGLLLRSGPRVYELDVATGAARWDVLVDPDHGAGRFFHVLSDAIITDRSDKTSLTHAVVVRGRHVVSQTALQSIIPFGASATFENRLYTGGIDPQLERSVLRAMDVASAQIHVDRATTWRVDEIVPTSDGLFVVNRAGAPGVYGVARDGTSQRALIDEPVQQLAVQANLALAVVREADDTARRTLRLMTFPELALRWSATARNAIQAFDGEAVVHVAPDDSTVIPILRDAATGTVRWRGSPLAREGTIHLAGPLVGFKQGPRMVLSRRGDGVVVGEIARATAISMLNGLLFVSSAEGLLCGRFN